MSTLLHELLLGNGALIVGHSDSAERAIAGIGAQNPDVVVIDIALRQGNGFDVLKSLRDHPPVKRPVRVILTNYTLASYRRAAERMGVDHFFDKSSEIPQLLRLVRSLYRGANKVAGTPNQG